MAAYKLFAATLVGLATAQVPGTISPEVHPKLTTWQCTKAGGCMPKNTALVIDSGAHWIHQKNNTNLNCSPTDKSVCPDAATCAQNCVIEGVSDYTTYGVYANGGSVKLDMYAPSGSIASPRLYLLAEDEKNYEMLKLTGNELSFDVDVSHLPCGMNGAFYLSEMEANGGQSALNPAGAAYGTGYCDAQCYVSGWVDGVANSEGKGVCCNEMDVWEANARTNQIAPHTCNKPSLFTCTGDDCTSTGACDEWGCADNPYLHRSDPTFYGPGLKVDTTKPFTVVTQFPADANGTLHAIVRKYVQGGKVIENTMMNVTMDQEYCDAQGGAIHFNRLGGMKGMGEALARGMVLALSIWWDQSGNMTWLDSGAAGPCNATEGNPSFITQVEKAPTVTFGSIKWGEIGSTYGGANETMMHWKT